MRAERAIASLQDNANATLTVNGSPRRLDDLGTITQAFRMEAVSSVGSGTQFLLATIENSKMAWSLADGAV